MMKIFITGGTGFIGKHVIEKLQNDNKFQVIALTRQKRNDQQGLLYVHGDVSDTSLISECIRASDYVIHMAGCKKDPKSFFQANVKGTENVIKACRKSNNLKKLIYLSSVGVIGKTSNVVVDEQTECHPINEYEKTKHQAELIVKEYSKQNPGHTIILRPTNVFGEDDQQKHLLNLMLKVRMGAFRFVGKDTSRYFLNYLYVKEISELMPRLLVESVKNDLYTINTPVPLADFIVAVQKILERHEEISHLPYWPVKLAAMCFDLIPRGLVKHPPVNSLKLNELTNRVKYSADRLSEDLDWRPVFTIKQALSNLAAYYFEKKEMT